jgi:hypothetical protein
MASMSKFAAAAVVGDVEELAEPDFDYVSHFQSLRIQQIPADGRVTCRPCVGQSIRKSCTPFDSTVDKDSDLSAEYLENRLAVMTVQAPCKCSHGNCLRKADKSISSLDFTNSVKMVLRCRNEIKDKSASARYDYLMEIFKNSVRNISHGISKDGLKLTSKIDSEFKLAVDESPNSKKILVCRNRFLQSVWCFSLVFGSIISSFQNRRSGRRA